MNKFSLKLCGWSGAIAVVLICTGFWMAGFIPIPSPNDSAEQTKELIMSNLMPFRFGMILSMFGSGFLVAYASAIFIHMKRIEGRYSVLSYLQFGSGALFSLEFIYLIFFWQAASFRPERSAELIQLVNDMAWIPFVGITCSAFFQAFAFGVVTLMQKASAEILPRWVGYFNIFCALSFLPGSFNVFFKTGPLAWNGLIAIYIPVVIYLVWNCLNGYQMAKAADSIDSE